MNPKPIIVKANPDLAKLCGIVPHMAGLDFECTEEQLDLGPLSAQSSLTHLSIRGNRRRLAQIVITGASLSRLPSSLRSLALQNIDVPPGSLGSLRFASLRSLTFCTVPSCYAPQELLTCLPNLEVHVTGFCNSPSAPTCFQTSAHDRFQTHGKLKIWHLSWTRLSCLSCRSFM